MQSQAEPIRVELWQVISQSLCTCRMLIYRCRLLLLIMHVTHYRRGGFFALALFPSSHHITSHLQFSILLRENEFLCQVCNIVSTKLLVLKRNLTISMEPNAELPLQRTPATTFRITIIILALRLLLILIITIAIKMIIVIIGIGIGFTC